MSTATHRGRATMEEREASIRARARAQGVNALITGAHEVYLQTLEWVAVLEDRLRAISQRAIEVETRNVELTREMAALRAATQPETAEAADASTSV